MAATSHYRERAIKQRIGADEGFRPGQAFELLRSRRRLCSGWWVQVEHDIVLLCHVSRCPCSAVMPRTPGEESLSPRSGDVAVYAFGPVLEDRPTSVQANRDIQTNRPRNQPQGFGKVLLRWLTPLIHDLVDPTCALTTFVDCCPTPNNQYLRFCSP